MVANCRGSDEPTHDADGKFAPGNQLGGSRLGIPNRASWVREQVLATCDDKAIEKLKGLRLTDPSLYWKVVQGVMPREVKAEIGEIGSIGEACDLALKRAGLTGQVRTELCE